MADEHLHINYDSGLGDGEMVSILEPPDDAAITCNCGDLVGYISIPEVGGDDATVHPCHCKLTPEELMELMTRNHPNLKD